MLTCDQSSLSWAGCGKTVMVSLQAPALEETAAQEDRLVKDFTAGGGVEFLLESFFLSAEDGYRDGVLGQDALSQLVGEVPQAIPVDSFGPVCHDPDTVDHFGVVD